MDVSEILASHASKFQTTVVEKETPLQVDPGLLLVSDPNPIDEDSYTASLETHLTALARDGVQTLLATLFTLPTKPSTDGPLAVLPAPLFLLPRAKPLPKPKPPTKWERFAAAKGIQHVKREKRVWDEERQEWVNRWGREGKNREGETAWITEVPANADVDYDPRKIARDARKERVKKNEKQQAQNLARATGISSRKAEIEKTLATTRVSTASMGKYDRKLDGEKEMRGVKRKFDPAETSAVSERTTSLNLLAKMESDRKKVHREPRAEESVLNVRKAVRTASRGRGGAALGRELSSSRGGRPKRK